MPRRRCRANRGHITANYRAVNRPLIRTGAGARGMVYGGPRPSDMLAAVCDPLTDRDTMGLCLPGLYCIYIRVNSASPPTNVCMHIYTRARRCAEVGKLVRLRSG